MTLTIFAVTCFFGFLAFFTAFMLHDKFRASLYQKLHGSHGWFYYYCLPLQWLLTKARFFYGTSWFGWQSFRFSLSIALFYPFIFFLLAYVVGGQHELNTIPLLPKHDDWYQRLLWPVAIVVAISAIFVLLRKEATLNAWFTRATLFKKAWVVIGISLFITIALFVRHGSPFTWTNDVWLKNLLMVFAFFVLLKLSFAYAVAVAAAAAFAGVVVVVVVGVGVGAVAVAVAQQIIALYLILPVINALWDSLSMAFSRYYTTQVVNPKVRTTRWLGHLAVDLVVGLVCLLGLLVCLPAVFEVYNAVLALASSSPSAFDWRGMAKIAAEDPWGKGLMVSLMLMSTLLPTAVHLIAGSFALLFRLAFWQKLLAKSVDELFFASTATLLLALTTTVVVAVIPALAYKFVRYWFDLALAEHLYALVNAIDGDALWQWLAPLMVLIIFTGLAVWVRKQPIPTH